MGLFADGGVGSWFPDFRLLRRWGGPNGYPRRRSKPLERSIRWVPVQLDDRELAADRRRPHELFVSQTALRQARDHLTGSGEEFGFLLGRRYFCRKADAPWIHISEALPASTSFPAGGEVDRFRLACISAKAQAPTRGLEVVGWYHEHRHLGPALTDQDHQLHGECFPSPWQCALVFVSANRAPLGAFIQPWRGERFFQRAVVSFQEVVEGAGKLNGDAPSCIDWANYAPERPVRRDRPLGTGNGRSATTPQAPRTSRPEATRRTRSRASAGDASRPAAAAPPAAETAPSVAEPPPSTGDALPSAADAPPRRQDDPPDLGSRRRVFTPPRMPVSRPQSSVPPRRLRIDEEHFVLLPPQDSPPVFRRLLAVLRRVAVTLRRLLP